MEIEMSTEKRPRYVVEYVHLDGNRYLVTETNDLQLAQEWVRLMRMSPKIQNLRLPVLITDRDNPEHGDINQ